MLTIFFIRRDHILSSTSQQHSARKTQTKFSKCFGNGLPEDYDQPREAQQCHELYLQLKKSVRRTPPYLAETFSLFRLTGLNFSALHLQCKTVMNKVERLLETEIKANTSRVVIAMFMKNCLNIAYPFPNQSQWLSGQSAMIGPPPCRPWRQLNRRLGAS